MVQVIAQSVARLASLRGVRFLLGERSLWEMHLLHHLLSPLLGVPINPFTSLNLDFLIYTMGIILALLTLDLF